MRCSWFRPSALWLLSIVLIVGLSCTSTKTRISSEWKSPDYTGGPMHKILVVAVSKTYLGRLTYEDRLAEALRSAGAEAVASYKFLPQKGRITKLELEEVVRREGFAGVIVTRLLGVEEKTTFVPPSTEVVRAPGGRYGGYYGYYGRSYDVVTTPGYTQTTEVVRLETQLWNAANSQLVWGIVSETFDKKTTDDGIASATAKVVSKLQEDGFLAPSE